MDNFSRLQQRRRPAGILKSGLRALTFGFVFGLVLVVLSACKQSGVEMPENNGSGSDLMRKSPCACQPVEFNGRGYEWAS